jgi:hypothetical protein
VNKFFCFFLLFAQSTHAQKNISFWTDKDSVDKNRILYSSIAIGTGYAGSLIGLQQVWYKDSYQKNFHLFNDGKNWLQMDKAGHFYASYQLTREISELYKWGGLSRNKADIIGSGIGFSYVTCLEIMDGFSKDWGFSIWDLSANFGGCALYLGQDMLFSKQIFLPKFSFHPTKYAALRPEILGSNFPQQLLKDYNGQTYWLSFTPGNFGQNQFPKWLCISIGYGADAKIVGSSDLFQDYVAKREFLLSFDIDFTQIKVKSAFLKILFKQINTLKIPFPSLYFSNDKFGFKPIYF